MQQRILATIIGVVAVALFLLNGCGSSTRAASNGNQAAPVPVNVRLASVEHRNSEPPVLAVGKLEAKEELRLSFKIGGIVERVFVEEGQRVTKGQLLASLRLNEIDAQLVQAQNGFDKAERDLKRVKALFADTVATLEQLQNATTAWEMAKAGLDAAAFNRKYAQIYAPSDGRVLRKLADDHEQVASGSPVLIIAGFDKGWVVRTGLADRDLLRIKTGDSARIDFGAMPGPAILGVVGEVGAAPNPMNGTYEVEIRLGQSEDKMVSGLIGKIAITPATHTPVSLVPIDAVVEASGVNATVFAIAPDTRTARRVPVTVAWIHDGKVAIPGELRGIEKVITAGATKLTDGAPVEVIQ